MSQSANNNLTTLNGLFKEVYANKLMISSASLMVTLRQTLGNIGGNPINLG